MAEITIRISDQAQKIAAGLVLGIALLAIALGVWSSGVFVPKYRLRVYVPQESGITTNSKVMIDGVRVGSVKAITPSKETGSPERAVEMDLRVDKRYQDVIRSDSVATISPVSPVAIHGSQYLIIGRGYKGTVLAPDSEIPFRAPREMSVGDIQKMLDCVQQLKLSKDKTAQAPPSVSSKSNP